MKKKTIGFIVLGIFLVLGFVAVIGSPGGSLPVSVKPTDDAPTYQDKLNSMTLEDCESVGSGSPPEIRDRCMQIWEFAKPLFP